MRGLDLSVVTGISGPSERGFVEFTFFWSFPIARLAETDKQAYNPQGVWHN
jgi:hypothetical protein